MYEIVLGIGKEWKNLTDLQRAGLAEALGGKRNARGLLAIFDNLDVLTSSYETSVNSAGSAAREQEHYAESVQYSIDRTKASLQELAHDFLSSDLLKGLIEGANTFLNIVDKIISSLGTVKSILAGVGIADFIRGIATGKGLTASIFEEVANKTVEGGAKRNLLGNILAVFGGTSSKKASQEAGEKLGEGVTDGLRKVVRKIDIGNGETEFVEELVSETAGRTAGERLGRGITESAPKTAKSFISKFAGAISAHPIAAAIGGVAVAGLVAKGVYDNYKANQVKTANTATDKYNDTKQTIESYKQQYTQLYNQLHNVNTTEAEGIEIRKQIIDLQSQITEQYGSQAAGVDLVNGKLDEQLAKLDAIYSKEAQDLFSDSDTRKAYKDAEKEMTRNNRSYTFGFFSEDSVGKEFHERLKEVAEEIEGVTYGDAGNGFYELKFTGNITDAETAIETLKNRTVEFRRDFKDDKLVQQGIDVLSDSLEKQGGKVGDVLDKYQENWKTGLEQAFHTELYGKGEDSLLSDYSAAIKEYNEAIASEDAGKFTEAQQKRADILEQLNNLDGFDYDSQIEPLIEDMDSVIDKSSEFRENVKDLFDDNGINKTNPLIDSVDEIKTAFEEIKKLELDEADFKEMTMSVDELDPRLRRFGEALDLSFDNADTYSSSVNMLSIALSALGGFAQEAATEVETTTQTFESFRTSIINDIANIDTLNAAIAESFSGKGLTYSIDENGELVGSIGEIKKAYGDLMKRGGIADSEVFEKTANGIHLNRDALRELQSQMEKNNKANFAKQEAQLYEEQASLQKRIAGMERYGLTTSDRYKDLKSQLELVNDRIESVRELSAAYDGATSAYQKWVDAQSMGEEGAMYDAIQSTALSRGKELYDAGLVGTNEFRAIAQLYSNQDLSTASIDDIVSAYEKGSKAVDKFFTEGHEGAQKFLNDVDDLNMGVEKIGDNDWLFNKADTNAIADYYGVSVDMIESIFRKLSDYGFDVSFVDDKQRVQISQFEKEAQNAANSLKKIGDTVTEVNGQELKLSDVANFDVANSSVEQLQEKLTQLKAFEQVMEVDPDVNTEEFGNLLTVIHNIEDELGILNGTKVSPQLTAEGIRQGEEYVENIKRALIDIEEINSRGGSQIDIHADNTVMSQLEYLSSFSKEDLKAKFNIDVDTNDPEAILGYLKGNVEAEADLEVNADLNSEELTAETATAVESAQPIVSADINGEELSAKTSAAVEGTTATVKVAADTTAASKTLRNMAKKSTNIKSTETTEKTTISKNEELTEKKTTISVDAGDSETVLNNISQKIDELNDKTATVTVEAETDEAEDAVEKVDDMEIADKSFNITANMNPALAAVNAIAGMRIQDKSFSISSNADYVRGQLDSLKRTLDGIKSKTITITTNRVTTGSGGGGGGTWANGTAHATGSYFNQKRIGSIGNSFINHYNGTAFARGDWGLKKDEPNALINELGPEILVRDGNYYILNSGFPTIANSPNGIPGGLRKDDIIFNHLQTAEILKKGYVTGSHAKMVGGRAHAQGIGPAHSVNGGGGFKGGASTQTINANNVNVVSKGGTTVQNKGGGSSGSGANSKQEKKIQPVDTTKPKGLWPTNITDEFFDLVEIRLNKLERDLNKLKDSADSTFTTFTNRVTDTNKAIKATENSIKGNNKAVKTYQKQANVTITGSRKLTAQEIKQASDLGFGKTAKEIRKNLNDGKFKIVDIKVNSDKLSKFQTARDDVKTAAKNYKKDQNKDTKKALQDANKTFNKYKKAGYGNEEIKESLKEKLKQYQEWHDKAVEAEEAVRELKEQERELYQQGFELIQTQYDQRIQAIDNRASAINSDISRLEAQGFVVQKTYYNNLKKLESERQKELKAEQKKLQKQLENAPKNGIKKNTEAYKEMELAIQEVNNAIKESQASAAEFDKQIRQLKWDMFDSTAKAISNVASEAEFLIDLLDEEKLFDDNGKITKEGTATLGLRAISYDTYMADAQAYAAEIKSIDKEIAKSGNKYNKELNDRRQEMVEGQQQAIQNAYKERDAIKSLVEEGIKKQIEAMKKAVTEYEKLLDTQQSEYKYSQSIADKQKEITQLRQQVRVWSGDDSEEGAVRRQKAKNDLEKAEQELAESQEERRIAQIKEALTGLQDDFEKLMNKQTDDVDKLIRDVIRNVNDSQSGIKTTVEAQAKAVGYGMSDSLRYILSDSGKMVSELTGKGVFETINNNVAEATKTIQEWYKRQYGEGTKPSSSSSSGSGSGSGSNSSTTAQNSKDEYIKQQAEAEYERLRNEEQKNMAELQKALQEDAKKAAADMKQQEADALLAMQRSVKSNPRDEDDSTKKTATLALHDTTGLDKATVEAMKVADKANAAAATGKSVTNVVQNYAAKAAATAAKKEEASNQLKNDIQRIIASGKARSKTLTTAEKKKSDLFQYLVKKYGITPTVSMYRQLAKKLGVSINTSKTPTAAQLTKLLSALKNKGFARGTSRVQRDDLYWTQEGKPEIVYRKSDGAMLTRLGKGDMVFTSEMTKNLWDMAKNPVSFKGIDIPKSQNNNIKVGDTNVQVSFSLPNVTNAEELMRELQRNSKFEKIIQDMTIGQLNGKRSLSKYATRI